jgi:group I intron endonuclease
MSIITNIHLKSSEKLAGIYEIRCSANDKVYVGQSLNLYQRKIDHFKVLRNHKADRTKPRHHCKYLQYAFNKYGEETFSFHVVFILDEKLVSRIKDKEVVKLVLKPLEQIYMNNYIPKQMFNSAPAAASTAGFKMTEEHKKDISERRKAPYRFYDPKIGYIEGRGLKELCKSRGIPSVGCLREVTNGNWTNTHGLFRSKEDYENWLEEQNSREFELYHPDLGVVKSNGRSMTQVEKDYGIPVGTISMMKAGLTNHTAGFFFSKEDYEKYLEKRSLTIYHPEEGEINIFRVVDFCKKRNLRPEGIYGILHKKDQVSYSGYFKSKEVYERLMKQASQWTSQYTGLERSGKNSWRFKIYKDGKVFYQEAGNDELTMALKYQQKRKELGLPELPLLRMDRLLGRNTSSQAS